jgi:TetR/AcrR family transcriptional regulator
LYESVEQAAAYSGDLAQTLNRTATVYFGYARAHPSFYRLQLSLWSAPPDSDAFQAVSRLNDQQRQIIEQLFIRAADDHGNMKGRHRAYGATFLGMVNTYVGLALNGFVTLDDSLVRSAIHQFMHGIFS